LQELGWERDQGDKKDKTTLSLCAYHSANILGDKMYVFGGLNKEGKPIDDFYEYSLSPKSSYSQSLNIFLKVQSTGRRSMLSKANLVTPPNNWLDNISPL